MVDHLKNRLVLNQAVLVRRFGGDEDLTQEVLALFLEQSERMLREVRVAIESGDIAEVTRAAHTIKGALGNIAADSATVVAERIEHFARCGDLENCRSLFPGLEHELERLTHALVAHTEPTAAR